MDEEPWKHLGPNAWSLVQYLYKHRNDPVVWVSRERLLNAVYGYKYPKYPETAIKNLVTYNNDNIRKHGWEVRSRRGYYGGYRLCKLGEEIPKQVIGGSVIQLEEVQ